MLERVLSNVPMGTADILSYTILVVVAVYLLSGPFIAYYYYRKNKRMKAVSPTGSA